MAYISNLEGIWTFDGSLEDQLVGNNFLSYSTTTYGSFPQYSVANDSTNIRRALKFTEGQTWFIGSSQSLSVGSGSGVFLSFWYYSPGVVGHTRHAITKKSITKIAPVIAYASSTTTNGIETVFGLFVVSEISVSDTHNAIQLGICDSSEITDIIVSNPYLPGWHYISVYILDKTSPAVTVARIEIDGDNATQYEVSQPASVITALRINSVGFGYTEHKTEQVGAMIADLVACSANVNTDSTYLTSERAIRMMRFGWESECDTSETDYRYSFLGTSYTQPSSISTNQLFVTGGNIYAARSNGQFLKGVRPIWDMEYDYMNNDSLILLDPIDQSKISWNISGLTISGTRIRI
jgi:hypothetical protein